MADTPPRGLDAADVRARTRFQEACRWVLWTMIMLIVLVALWFGFWFVVWLSSGPPYSY